ncbi:hypothetical protein JCM8208_005991 [Rhodotorula glutinis]
MSSTGYFQPRSPLSGDSSRPASPSGSGAASPPGSYLRIHPSRAPHSPLAISTNLGVPAQGAAVRSPTSPGRAQTHRTLGHIPLGAAAAQAASAPAYPPHLHSASRQSTSMAPPHVNHSTVTTPLAAPATTSSSYSHSHSLTSPCYVHSHLDHTLNDVVKRDGAGAATGSPGAPDGTPRAARKKLRSRPSDYGQDSAQAHRVGEPQHEQQEGAVDPQLVLPDAGVDSGESGDETSDDEKNTWTRQLAETAVSVREMSRQLGRARVVSHIQSVMIVTKARDNQLTRVTRELALWLMKTPRDGKDRGLIVYVDSQLQKSKRFDAAGLQRENPELFRPLPHRRYSRTSSSASLATDAQPRRDGVHTPGAVRGGGALTPLTMTNLSEALLKRNSSISSSSGEAHAAKRNVHDPDEGQLRYWTNEMCRKSPHLFDFVVTLGGDGTILYTSWLFQQVVPPVIPFALGSLGFLTNFDIAKFRETLDAAIDTGVRVNLRMRFTCTVYRAVTDDGTCKRRAVRSGKTGGIFMKSLTREGWDAIESGKPLGTPGGRDKEIKCFSTRAVESFEVLNDLVVDRGPSPYVSQLELFGDEHHMTTVQADGLTVSTPTGSTAYSLSAGGSLVHPEIPAILITPICPHTLSFRPMLLPDSMELRICVPYNSRSTAWASFDGRGRVELRQGDHIKVTASPYPFPTVCADKQSTDWFHSIARTLKWNERQRQKSFVILEEGRKKPRSSTSGPAKPDKAGPSSVATDSASRKKQTSFAPDPVQAPAAVAEDDEDEDEEEEEEDEEGDDTEEEYDIDDVSESTTNASSPSLVASDAPHHGHHRDHTASSSSSSNLPPLIHGHAEPSGSPALVSHSHATGHPISAQDLVDMSSNASSISVDIQDDPTERYATQPPRSRGRSRSRGRTALKDARRASKGAQESDADQSEDRAFAVVGHDEDDEDDSSQQSVSDQE